MSAQNIIRIVGYATSAIVSLAGVAILGGLLVPTYVPENFRVAIGVVLVLYGIYRSATLWAKQRQERRSNE